MKKVLAILLVLVMLLGLTACGEELSMVATNDPDFIVTDGYYFATKGNNAYASSKVYYGNKQLKGDELRFHCYGENGNPSGTIGWYKNEGLFVCEKPTQEGTFGIDIIYETHVMHTGWHIEDLAE